VSFIAQRKGGRLISSVHSLLCGPFHQVFGLGSFHHQPMYIFLQRQVSQRQFMWSYTCTRNYISKFTFVSWYVNQISATSVADLSWTSSFFSTSSKVLGPTKLKLNSRSAPAAATAGRWSCRLQTMLLTNRLANMVKVD
jgi:hypothetical protein